MPRKDKVIGKSVRIEQGEKADTVLEYEHRRSGATTLVGVRYLPKVSNAIPDLTSLKVTDIIAFNSAAEQAFVELLAAMCDAAGEFGVSVRVARAEIAFRLGVSTETVKRYIEKWVAPSAPFFIRDGMIFVKTETTEEEKQRKRKRKE